MARYTGSDFFEKACSGSYFGINIIVFSYGCAYGGSDLSAVAGGKFIFVNDR